MGEINTDNILALHQVDPQTPWMTILLKLTGSSQGAVMAQNPFSPCVLVMTETRIQGIITSYTIIGQLARSGCWPDPPLEQIMNQPVITVGQNDLSRPWFILSLFQEHAINHLPVVDHQGQPLGYLTPASLQRMLPAGNFLRARQVQDLLNSPYPQGELTLSLLQGAQVMAHQQSDWLVVVENRGGEGFFPLGVVTAQDLIQAQLQGLNLALTPLGEIISQPLSTVFSQTHLQTVWQIFCQENIAQLGVINESGQLQGVLTHRDLLKNFEPQQLLVWVETLHQQILALQKTNPPSSEFPHRQLAQPLFLENRAIALDPKDLLEQINQDRSDKEEALRSLAENEQRFRQLAENIHQVFYLTDIENNQILYVGPSYEKIWQRSCQSLYDAPHSYLESIHPEDQDLAFAAYSRQRLGQQTETEYRIQRPNGSWRWILDRCFPVKNEQGQIYRVCGIAEDITERKELELQLQQLNQNLEQQVKERTQALQKSEERWQLAVEGSNDGIWDWDLETNRVFFSPRWCSMLGYGVGEIKPKPEEWFDRIHPEDSLAVSLQLQAHLKGETDFYNCEQRLRTKDGSYKWILARGKVVCNAQEKIIRIVGSHTDISERKEMENRLQRQLAAIDAASDGIGVADAQGVYIYLNQTHALIFGYDHPDELLGRTWKELYIPEEVERIEKEVFPQLQSQGRWQGEAIARRKDGSLFEQEFSLTAVEHIGLICVCRDITERKKQERLIMRQNQQEHLLRDITARIRCSLELNDIFQTTTQETRRLIQADRVAIFKFRPQTHYNEGQFVAESVAPGWDSVLAVPLKDHCFGDRFASLYQQGHYQALFDIQKTELEACHRQVLEKFRIRANLVLPIVTGSKLWGLLCIHQCSDPRIWQPSEIKFIQQIANQLAIALQQAMLVAHLRRELSQRRQAQKELEQSYHHLELSNLDLAQANRRTEEFLAAMSHELRTPLNSILGVSQALQEKLIGDLNPRQVKSIETIFQSGEHLLALINDILDLSKVRAGKLELQLEPANLQELCQVILQMIRQLAFKKNINLQCHLPPQPLNFWCDSRRLRQVLINLLNNAVKFTPKGGNIDFAAELVSQSVPPQLRFTIKDTGIGISAENQTKLFQPFVQIDSRLNRQYEGTGLGLALVKRLTELHGGQVEVVSAINEGSCFTVSIPYRACQQALTSVETGDVPFPGHSPPPTTEAPLILVAEDNIANRESLENYLEYKGYRLLFAENGEEALAIIHEHRPDLVLMDVQMPVLDGIEATRRVRLEPEFASLPIIALTALTMPNHRQMCLEAGMNEYMSKPIQFRQLVLLMEKLLAECSPL